MASEPPPAEFARRYRAGEPQVVWRTLVADLETPVSAFLKLARDRPNCFLLESVEGGAVRGRYSIVGIAPDLVWRCRGDGPEINRDALADPDAFVPDEGGALDSLRRLLAESRIELPPELPPMAAGLVGYMGFDTVRLIERLPTGRAPALGLPDGVLVRPTVMAVFDTVADTVTLATPVYPSPERTEEDAREDAARRIGEAVAALGAPLPAEAEARADGHPPPEPVSNMEPGAYRAMVRRAKEYILDGDIFQVVLSQRFAAPFRLPPFALYRALRRLNPSPFLFYLDVAGAAVVGSSPEILVRVRDGAVTVRPIAGTRRRGADRAEDEALERELLADPKELAEHLMLLDLGRNDAGRVSLAGSVRVTERMTVERYSHVMHIVSNVTGDLDPAHDSIDALMAGFPAGTVSGAPKVRALEIIDELEPERRGIYAGCVGYFSVNGSMDTCIALRTAVVKDGTMYVQAGAGIVADSDPESEHQETVSKARALFHAAEEAVRFAGGDGRG